MSRSLAVWFYGVTMAATLAACVSAKQIEQGALTGADFACLLDHLDPGLEPAAVQAAIEAACGKLPDIHTIVDAQTRLQTRVQARQPAKTPASAQAPAPALSCAPAASR